jgi:FemAB-related protein (PEP-CTERM system-associated)
MTLSVDEFAGSTEEWDAFVRKQDGWTHYHLHGWRAVISGVHGHPCPYLVARDAGGAIRGVLPLVRMKSRVFGHFLVSMPFLNYGGPLGDDAAVAALVDRATRLAREGDVKLLELRSGRRLPIALPLSLRKITVILDLPAGEPEALWRAVGSRLRSDINRPRKRGVTVRFGADQLGAFFAVFSRHMRELGTPTQPRRFFEAIARTFPETHWIGCAYVEERPVACGFGFLWDGEYEMSWGSSLDEFKSFAPNMLLYWSFMERAAEAGLTRFNFGRCSPGSGTHRFKQQWRGRDEQLWWYDLAPAPGAKMPSPDGGAFAWGPRFWRRLPTPVATALGPRIVRYLP